MHQTLSVADSNKQTLLLYLLTLLLLQQPMHCCSAHCYQVDIARKHLLCSTEYLISDSKKFIEDLQRVANMQTFCLAILDITRSPLPWTPARQ